MRVEGRSAGKLRGAKVDPQGDHRIAMALAVAALGAEGDTTIRDADCVAFPSPNFSPLSSACAAPKSPGRKASLFAVLPLQIVHTQTADFRV